MGELAKVMIVVGVALVLLGSVLSMLGKLPWQGRLPGDIVMHRDHFTFLLPLGTCVVVSIVLTVLFWLIRR